MGFSTDFFEWFVRESKKVLPKNVYEPFLPFYHYLLSLFSALLYRFPSRKLVVVGVTGTKGKSSVCEIVAAILEEAGYKTALASTIRFKIAGNTKRNLYKMTMPGRFFLQKFLHDAWESGCTHVVLEMTSEGVKQFRHKFIYLDALIFTNLSPEHIETHGSYENYRNAKLQIAKGLSKSPKRPRTMVANSDDAEAKHFLSFVFDEKKMFSINDAQPYKTTLSGATLTWRGQTIQSKLKGMFNVQNILAAAAFSETQNISPDTVKNAVEKIEYIPGRMEKVSGESNTPFDVYVDYAHTPDSLEKVYEALGPQSKICVFGATGGGRDKWKRPVFAKIAEEHCKKIILTDEDPYDEDPMNIIKDVEKGFTKKNVSYEIIIDRRLAIQRALQDANKGDAVVITGKGTDPFIMGPGGTKTPWDDRNVVQGELENLH